MTFLRRSLVAVFIAFTAASGAPLDAANPDFGSNPLVFTPPKVLAGTAKVSVVEPAEIPLENGFEIRDLSYAVTEAVADGDGTVAVEWVAERRFEVPDPMELSFFDYTGEMVASTSSFVQPGASWVFHAEVSIDGSKAIGCQVPLSDGSDSIGEEEAVKIPTDCGEAFNVSLGPGMHTLEYNSGISASGLAPGGSPGDALPVSVYRATLSPVPSSVLEIPTVRPFGLALIALLLLGAGLYLAWF